MWKFWESKRPWPPDSTTLDCAPSGAMRKVHGEIIPGSAVAIRAQI